MSTFIVVGKCKNVWYTTDFNLKKFVAACFVYSYRKIRSTFIYFYIINKEKNQDLRVIQHTQVEMFEMFEMFEIFV